MGGFFDLQVNGYAGVEFNCDDLGAEDLHRACRRLAADGVEGILATIVTEDLDRMTRRMSRIAEIRRRDELVARMVVGLHVEGPFLSPVEGYRGAHPLEQIRPAETDAARRLLDAGGGLVKVLTLAPECDEGLRVTRMLCKAGVVVSAGHCDPSIDQLRSAIGSGLSMFTHLGNGCPMHMHRHDNIIQRVLSLPERIWLTFIADGMHVAFTALGNYLRLAGADRCVVVTDAIAPAGEGPGRYKSDRWDVVVGPELVAIAPDGSHLIGSAVTMKMALENLTARVGLPRDQAVQLTTVNPRKAIGEAGGRKR